MDSTKPSTDSNRIEVIDEVETTQTPDYGVVGFDYE